MFVCVHLVSSSLEVDPIATIDAHTSTNDSEISLINIDLPWLLFNKSSVVFIACFSRVRLCIEPI